ncbi:hypothetical protein Patl1_33654 [Pistacia atlantica]|uniref:Uncharacterized protein n=1 Tax=Pistacia atlantica TaxID=434234 RepID=A0ACC0ZSY4_9ROSI|nr:hypothetical protein Patl1_33654 [Pistacia atlantica]
MVKVSITVMKCWSLFNLTTLAEMKRTKSLYSDREEESMERKVCIKGDFDGKSFNHCGDVKEPFQPNSFGRNEDGEISNIEIKSSSEEESSTLPKIEKVEKRGMMLEAVGHFGLS